DHARRHVPLQREKRTDPAALHIAGARGKRYHPAGRARDDPRVYSGAETAAASPRPRSAEVIRRRKIVPLPGRVSVNWRRYGPAIVAVAAAATFCGPSAALAQDYPTRPIPPVGVTAARGLLDRAAPAPARRLRQTLGP